MQYDDALRFVVDCLRNPSRDQGQYGYSVWLPNVINRYLVEHEGAHPQITQNAGRVRELSPIFYAAAWDLCRQGVLRPGIHQYGEQATADGSGGNGYSVTPYGETWLRQAAHLGFVITSPDLFSYMLEIYRPRLGDGFMQRAVEANRAYYAGAHLAACAMCGAAAESILLAAAIAKEGDEEIVLDQYRRAGGRRHVESMLLGKAPDNLRRSVSSYTDLLNYWRDEAAHGVASTISEMQAHEALARLLRFAQVVTDRWDELVQDR